jgi:TIR domain
MATLREYFDTDFGYTLRIHITLPTQGSEVFEGAICYDFSGFKCFLTFYVPGEHNTLDLFLRLLRAVEYGKGKISLSGRITILSSRYAHGEIRVNNAPFEISMRFFGDPEWLSYTTIESSRRIIIYSETQLAQNEISALKAEAKTLGHEIQFWSKNHAAARSQFEGPRAFISHDSRDKEIAKKIAIGLQKMICPVWYDEFTLKVGDNLRDSIEKGLKECKKCVLILSKNFFSNMGWTKKEFDSIFTREILEETKLVLPVWNAVTKEEVYEYSPSLLNVKGLDWNALGEREVCAQLFRAINI